MTVPPLDPHCSSWIVVDRATLKPVYETWSADVAAKVNQTRYHVFTSASWLAALNRVASICAAAEIKGRQAFLDSLERNA